MSEQQTSADGFRERFESSLLGRWYLPALLAIALGLHVHHASIGWSHTIFERGSFRQSQTALSTYFAYHDGFRIDYETPLFGPPWSIPLEFPLYQWSVAVAAWTTGLPIETCARGTSLLCFYAAAVLLWFVLGECRLDRRFQMLGVLLVLVHPHYVYWSRTFLIESQALLLSLLFLLAYLKHLRTRHPGWLAVACIAGIAAGLVKVTTFFVFTFFALVLQLARVRDDWPSEPRSRVVGRFLLAGVVGVAIPVVAVLVWTHHADAVKASNPLTVHIVSANLRTWNHGTLTQRLVPATWVAIAYYTRFGLVLLPLFAMLVPTTFVASARHRLVLLAGLAGWAAGPLVFTNLYVRHDYYAFANVVFLCIVFAATLHWGTTVRNRWLWGLFTFVVVPGVLVALVVQYRASYLPYQRHDNRAYRPFNAFVDSHLDKEDVILVVGAGWDPTLPYAAGRRAIMVRHTESREVVADAIERVGPERVRAIVLSGTEQDAAAAHWIEHLQVAPRPFFDETIRLLHVSPHGPEIRHRRLRIHMRNR